MDARRKLAKAIRASITENPEQDHDKRFHALTDELAAEIKAVCGPKNPEKKNNFLQLCEAVAEHMASPFKRMVWDMQELEQKFIDEMVDVLHAYEPTDFPQAREINEALKTLEAGTVPHANAHTRKRAIRDVYDLVTELKLATDSVTEAADALYPEFNADED